MSRSELGLVKYLHAKSWEYSVADQRWMRPDGLKVDHSLIVELSDRFDPRFGIQALHGMMTEADVRHLARTLAPR